MTVDPAIGPYPYGSRVLITATPNQGAYFAGWGNQADGTQNPLEFIVTNSTPAVCALFLPGQNTAPPSITTQPVNTTVVVGNSATLHVTVNGASPFTYQWRRNGMPIPGATSSTFVVLSVAAGDAGIYDVVIANAFGTVTSAPATITVVSPPSIIAQPASQLIASGTKVTFTVGAIGSGPLSYQWHRAAGPIPNETNATYTIEPASTNDAGNYFVVVSNPYGSRASQDATLTVYGPVTFVAHPTQVVVPLRGTATFSGLATGFPDPAYQWLFKGKPVVGATATSLVITNVGTNHLGAYSLVASNAYSMATSAPAMLLMSPSIRAPFIGGTVVWGKSGFITASAVGSGNLTYQWYKDGVAVPGATGPTLNFPIVQLTDAGFYSLVVSSEWGSVTNVPAQLVVNPASISLEMYAGLTIDGVPGFTYGIQYSTNLQTTNAWTTATNYTLTVPVETWIDFDSPGKAKRFYRVVVP